ncbi:hypothetical protein ACEXQB_010135 [Herbiconiux sp. P18]|uniref:hypothetical protein n=1 Tax=Herbiconiux liangxiaofengii TaxID=3342795 RepID=UPI003CF0FC8F
MALADDAREVREAAADNGNPKLRLDANRAERQVLESLVSQLGVHSTEAAQNLRDAQALTAALARTIPAYGPELARKLAVECKAAGASDDFVTSLDTFAARLESHSQKEK